MYTGTTLRLEADNEIEYFVLEDLEQISVTVKNNATINLKDEWVLLKVPYRGTITNITDILINNTSIEHLLYTGYFEDITGQKFQPATSVWAEGGFNIWIHPNLGYMKGQLFEQINNGDYGTSLFDKYMLTVDRPIIIPAPYPNDIKDFFSYGAGPRWWNKKNNLPYQTLDDEVFDDMSDSVQKVVSKYCNNIEEHPFSNKWSIHSWTTSVSNADPVPINDNSFEGLGKYFRSIGWNNVLTVEDSQLGPHGWIRLHIDDHPNSKNRQHIEKLSKLYFTYENKKDILFKLHGVGLVPVDKPLLINTWKFAHCVVNLGNETRKTFIAYGANI